MEFEVKKKIKEKKKKKTAWHRVGIMYILTWFILFFSLKSCKDKETPITEQTLYSHDYCHNIELFNTVTEQTLYSNDYCHNIELKTHFILNATWCELVSWPLLLVADQYNHSVLPLYLELTGTTTVCYCCTGSWPVQPQCVTIILEADRYNQVILKEA